MKRMKKPNHHLSLTPREFSVQALKTRIELIKEAKSELLIEACAMCEQSEKENMSLEIIVSRTSRRGAQQFNWAHRDTGYRCLDPRLMVNRASNSDKIIFVGLEAMRVRFNHELSAYDAELARLRNTTRRSYFHEYLKAPATAA